MARDKDKNVEIDDLKDKLANAKDYISGLELQLEERIQEKPIKSVMIAFGAGLVAGVIATYLMRRR